MTDRSAYWAKYYAENREKAKAKTAAWLAANRDRKRQQNREYAQRNASAIKVRKILGVPIQEARKMLGESKCHTSARARSP